MRFEISEFNSEAYDQHIIDVGHRRLAVDIFDNGGGLHIYDVENRLETQFSLLTSEVAELVSILTRKDSG